MVGYSTDRARPRTRGVMAITKGSLVLVPVALCLLLVLQVGAQGTTVSDDGVVVMVNGTLACSNNATADLEDFPVEAQIKGDRIGFNSTNSDGEFTINVPPSKLTLSYPFPQYISVYPSVLRDEDACPGGRLEVEEAYAKVTYPDGSFIGVQIYENGTRKYDRYGR